jgi:hypothetical protein
VQAYRGNFELAAKTIIARLPATAKKRDKPRAFWFHNNLMMLRAAQGDLVGALLECYEMRTVGAAGTWPRGGGTDRVKHVAMKDQWHRALYLRLLAERKSGSQRRALVRYAKRAKAAYRQDAEIGFRCVRAL